MSKKRNKVYDVNFRPVATAMFTVLASSQKDARKVAEEQLDSMSKEEIADRLLAAVDFMGLKVTAVSYIEDYEDEE